MNDSLTPYQLPSEDWNAAMTVWEFSLSLLSGRFGFSGLRGMNGDVSEST